ncbi:MAG: glycerate kinase [Deltaproteobacteria bacterium]|nr:glycerate kinase [Deltaproteobacteria bacterium]
MNTLTGPQTGSDLQISFKRPDRLIGHAKKICAAGIASVNAKIAVARACAFKNGRLFIGETGLDLTVYDNIYVIGAGKATAAMAAAMEEILSDRISGGIISVKYGHTEPLCRIETRIKMMEAGHPVPDDAGLLAAQKIMKLVSAAGKDDLVICLISGGGSALLPLPAQPVTLVEKQEAIRQLLSCGAAIDEINAIRKHISAIKGGQLARAAWPATLVTLMVSDVVGDPMDVIASGPTVADTSTFSDCLLIMEKYGLVQTLPQSVTHRINAGVAGKSPETPKPGDPVFAETKNLIVAANFSALKAAKDTAESLGYNTIILSSCIEGDTSQAAGFHAAIAKEIKMSKNPAPPPACILSGGETTVKIVGNGLGGRNQEFVLVAAQEIAGQEDIVILSCGTDGTDGPTDAAGAIADGSTISRAETMGLDVGAYLSGNDSYHFFEKTGDLIKTGPTGTNVMDLRIIIVG